ncbi:MAG: transposase [Pseudomonadales bacterium]|nr:transposase [Pseudomonadales bacterium]
MTSNNKAKGLFDRKAFAYIARDDEYECPAGERLTRRTKMLQKGQVYHRYWSSACGTCQLKSRCTTGKERRVSRWEHEDTLERAAHRLEQFPKAMSVRRAVVEHPFGTLKQWMGTNHLLLKTREKVKIEVSLHVLAYNMKRVIKMIGTDRLIEAM